MFPRSITSSSLFIVLLASRALAGIYVTNPVASTVSQAGQSLTVQWVDDGTHPLLNTIGKSSIDLYTGNPTEQTFLASLGNEIDVSQTNSVTWNVDGTVGPSGTYYFIRFTSKDTKDPLQPTYPYTAFSAIFRLDGMTGQFNNTIQSQLNANSTMSPPAASRTTGVSGAGTSAAGSITGVASSVGSLASSGLGSLASSVIGSGSGSGSGSVASSVSGGTSVSGSNSITRPVMITSPTMTRPASTLTSPTNSPSPSPSSGNSVSLARELSHAGIGAVVVGCMGLGLALFL